MTVQRSAAESRGEDARQLRPPWGSREPGETTSRHRSGLVRDSHGYVGHVSEPVGPTHRLRFETPPEKSGRPLQDRPSHCVGLLSSHWNLLLTPVELRKLLERAKRDERLDSEPDHERRRSARRYRRRLTPDDQQHAVAAYGLGATIRQIAKELGSNPTTVSGILKRQGVRLRLRSPEPCQVDAMVRLYESGLSLARVGEQLGFDARTVQHKLRERGVERRDTHGRRRSSWSQQFGDPD